MTDAVASDNFRGLIAMLHYARPYRAQWSAIVALTVTASAVALLTPWPMQFLVDHVLGDVPLPPALARLLSWAPDLSSAPLMIALVVSAGLLLLVVNALLDAVLTCAGVRVGQ